MTGVDEARVRAAWDESRFALGIGADEPARLDLVARYGQTHRSYHGLAHIAACVTVFDDVRALAERPGEVLSALLFHDAVYEPLASDNEARSAALASAVLSRGGAYPGATERIERAIARTKDHGAASDADAALVCDVDLSILAAPTDVFDVYEGGVRAEYAAIPDAAFARGRANFIERFLARPQLFQTPALACRWDERARANLKRSLSRWRSPGA